MKLKNGKTKQEKLREKREKILILIFLKNSARHLFYLTLSEEIVVVIIYNFYIFVYLFCYYFHLA